MAYKQEQIILENVKKIIAYVEYIVVGHYGTYFEKRKNAFLTV